MNNFYNDEGLVLCQICKKPFNFITGNHLTLHNTSMAEYRSKFPDAPIARKGYFDDIVAAKKRKSKSKFKPKIIELVDEITNPKIEEFINEDEIISINENESFKENENVKSLKKDKIPTVKNKDPMQDKLDIIDFFNSIGYDIKNNFVIFKKSSNGTIEGQFVTDMADPNLKVIFDFPNSFWHNQTSISESSKDIILKDMGWKIITFSESMPRVINVKNKLKIN